MHIFLYMETTATMPNLNRVFPILPAPSKIEDTKRNPAILNSSGVPSYTILICGFSTGALSTSMAIGQSSAQESRFIPYHCHVCGCGFLLKWDLTLMSVSHGGMCIHCGKHHGESAPWAHHVLKVWNSKHTNLHQIMFALEISASVMTPKVNLRSFGFQDRCIGMMPNRSTVPNSRPKFWIRRLKPPTWQNKQWRANLQ